MVTLCRSNISRCAPSNIRRVGRAIVVLTLTLATLFSACGEITDEPTDEEATTDSAAIVALRHITVRTPRTPRSYPSVKITTWVYGTPRTKCVRVNPGVWSSTGIYIPKHTWVDFNVHTDSACQSRPCCYINAGNYSPGDGGGTWPVDLK